MGAVSSLKTLLTHRWVAKNIYWLTGVFRFWEKGWLILKKGTGGISFFGLLTVLFIGLKLGGAIAWSWFWVLSPILLPMLILLTIGAIALTISMIITLVAMMIGDDK